MKSKWRHNPARKWPLWPLWTLWTFTAASILLPSSHLGIAAPQGYLTRHGPAPLRFDRDSDPNREKAILRPLEIPVLNPGISSPASTQTIKATEPVGRGDALKHPATTTTTQTGSAQPAEALGPPLPGSFQSATTTQDQPRESSAQYVLDPPPAPLAEEAPPSEEPHTAAGADPEAFAETEPLSMPISVAPQMFLPYFQSSANLGLSEDERIVVPITFMAPHPAPPARSSATYQRVPAPSP